MSDFATLEFFVSRGLNEPYIRLLRLPHFKNVLDGTEITFDYPITALIGPNGTNKSSILRALQGCPNRFNIGDYWFDTPLDRLADGQGDSFKNPHRYIHGYRTPSGALAEVIKARVGKTSRGADYFETSAPRIRDGMQEMPNPSDPADADLRRKTRWKPIEKDIVYLDFRQELPAYDILMHFNWRKHSNEIDSKKKQIRRGGPHVSRAIDGLEPQHELYGANRILEPAEELDSRELAAVSQVLQRDYDSIRLVKHDYFGVEGYTAALTTPERRYSEAYAGSGEFAAIMMVRAIARAAPKSLLLLDEPETSLHPGAQAELMRFIAKECVQHKHQVVIATHSPSMVADLPDSARKLFDFDKATGRVQLVAQSASASEAFVRIGAAFTQRTILVEDALARQIVLRAARDKGPDFFQSIDVVALPGGAETIVRRVATVQAQLGSPYVVLLDGDQRPEIAVRDAHALVDSELQAELDKVNVPASVLIRDGGSGNPETQLASARRKTLEWVNSHIEYLPSEVCPETLLLEMLGESAANSIEAKRIWEEKSHTQLGLLESEQLTSDQILNSQSIALAGIQDHPYLTELGEVLDELLARASHAP